jgi:hypothetical protein
VCRHDFRGQGQQIVGLLSVFHIIVPGIGGWRKIIKASERCNTASCESFPVGKGFRSSSRREM